MAKWISIAEATQVLGISERSLRYRIAKATIESKLENGKRLVHVEQDTMPHENLNAILHEKDCRIADLQQQVDNLQEQLGRRDETVDHLTQLVAIAQKNVLVLTERFQAIEDMRKRSFWQRLLRQA